MRYNKETLIEKLNFVHNNSYDYSLVDFKTTKDKIIIICPIHGQFEQNVSNHINGQGCKKCGYNRLKSNSFDFIDKSKIIHNNFYDYSLVEYVNSYTKVKIICPIHGVFEQKPNSHLNGQTCKKCIIDNHSLNLEKFLLKAKDVHGNFYNYSFVKDILNNKQKIKIICPEHGDFEQTISNHLSGYGCRECSNDKYRNNDYIEKAKIKFSNKYDYSLVKYLNNKSKVQIICPEHDIFEQSLKSHLKQDGCPYCSGKKMNTDLFIEKSNTKHNNKYDYSKVIYKDAFSKVQIICPKHGDFEQTASVHLSGSGCPVCKSSKGEREIIKLLEQYKLLYIHQKKFDDCKNVTNLIFDFYIPDINLCIEYNGMQHYKPIKHFGGSEGLKITKKRDNIKKEYCKSKKINYKVISYKDNIENKIDEILNEERKDN
jgi:hypothetical protein